MTQRDFDLLALRRPSMDDLAVNEYGDRVYGTPEATLWADALERARARIENPRFLASGIALDGVSGNIDSPEIVNEEIFTPLQNAIMPRQVIDNQPKALTDVDRSLIDSRRAEAARLEDRLKFDRDREKRIAFDEEQERALAEKKALNDFNLRSSTVQRQGNRSKEFAIKGRIEMAREAVLNAQRLRDPEKEAEALAELEKWESELTDSVPTMSASPVLPSIPVQPEVVTRVRAPASQGVDVAALRAQAQEALKRKDPAAVRAKFKELTGQDL